MTAREGAMIGGEVTSFKVSVSIRGDELDPEEITRLLGRAPDSARAPGSSRPSQQKVGYWSASLRGMEGDKVEDSLSRLLGQMKSEPEIWSSLSAKYDVSVNVLARIRCENREASLSSSMVREISLRGASLWFDIYCFGE